jgi:predicted ribosomally synthesized peptide with nif11-like leader
MSEEQLTALLAKLKEDAGLREKFKGAADLDAVVAIAKEAGFDVSKADWLKHQAKQTMELGEDELEAVAGAGCGNNTGRGKTGYAGCQVECAPGYNTLYTIHFC